MTEAESMSDRLQRLLEGKVVMTARATGTEMTIEFTDGTRLFVDHREDGIELSVT